MKGTYLGEFEEIVLLCIAGLAQEAYGLAIQQELESQTNRSINLGAVHAACNRLQDKGFLDAHLGEKSQKRGGRRKKIYQVTTSGKEALESARDLRQRLWTKIASISFNSGLDHA
jgi:DNA-binding PadR family transcriptional regulator